MERIGKSQTQEEGSPGGCCYGCEPQEYASPPPGIGYAHRLDPHGRSED